MTSTPTITTPDNPKQKPPNHNLTNLVICVILAFITAYPLTMLLQLIDNLGGDSEQQQPETREQPEQYLIFP